MSIDNSTTKIRIMKEMQQCKKISSEELIINCCIDQDIHKWNAYIIPPNDSFYHGMKLELSIVIPPDYPYTPPEISFVTPIFHPNINRNGTICISTLNKDWSPALTLEKTLLSIMSLLDEPNPNDPLRPDAADLFMTDKKKYFEEVTKTYDENNNKY